MTKLALTPWGRAGAIWKRNNDIYCWLIRSRPTIAINKTRCDTSGDWQIFAKNFITISNDPISDVELLKLNFHILALGYLEEKPSYFTEVATNIKEELPELPQVSDSEKEKNRKKSD